MIKNSQGIEGKRDVKQVKTTIKREISIPWDQYVHFVNLKNNSGNNVHNGHPKHHDPSTLPIPTRLLDDDEDKTVHHVVESACN